MSVGKRLFGGERLGGDHEQRGGWVEVVDRVDQIAAVHVGHKPTGDAVMTKGGQRLIGHDRTKIRAADTDVDHRLDGLAGCPSPIAGSNTVGKLAHLIEHVMDVGNDVRAILEHFAIGRGPQRGVQHGAVFGGVDAIAAQHRGNLVVDPCVFRQRHQVGKHVSGDAMLGEVHHEIADGQRQPIGTVGLVGEERAKLNLLETEGHLFKRCPGGKRCWIHALILSS